MNFADQHFISLSGIVKDDRVKKTFGRKLNFYIEAEDFQQSYEVGVNAKGEFQMDSLIFSGIQNSFMLILIQRKNKTSPYQLLVNERRML